MKLTEIKAKAKKAGLDPAKFKKDDLIRNIQRKEGNNVCYKSGKVSCDQFKCCWIDDCIPGK